MTPITKPPQVPDEWPEFGELDGKQVRLRDAVKDLPRDRLSDIVIDVPGAGKVRPWRGLAMYEEEY